MISDCRYLIFVTACKSRCRGGELSESTWPYIGDLHARVRFCPKIAQALLLTALARWQPLRLNYLRINGLRLRRRGVYL